MGEPFVVHAIFTFISLAIIRKLEGLDEMANLLIVSCVWFIFLVCWVAEYSCADYSYRDFEVLRKMIRKEKDTPRDSIERQEQDARAVVTYCENDSDCRRVQLLQFFGEKFDKRLCSRRCDNCRSQDVLVEHDLTKEAGNAVALVRSFSTHVTLDQCRLILKGSKNASVLNKGHDKLRLYGAASHLSMEVIELLFAKLLFLDALVEESIANASGWHNQYVKVGDFLRSRYRDDF